MTRFMKPALALTLAAALAAAAVAMRGDPAVTVGPPIEAMPAAPAASPASRPTPRSGAGLDATGRLDSLAGLLDREVEERLRLEEEVVALRRRLASLERELGTSAPAPVEAPPSYFDDAGGGDRGDISTSRFVAAGFSESDAADYRRRLDEAAMARLYLRDQAQREGWLNSDRYRQELAALPNVEQELRREMDEDTYARYLYATGRPNQVTVRRVLDGSAAAVAGLQAGDVLLRYDGQRIYDSRTVRRTTRDGNAGETVTVEILRNGQRLQAFLPRGPIGVTMDAASVPPDAPLR